MDVCDVTFSAETYTYQYNVNTIGTGGTFTLPSATFDEEPAVITVLEYSGYSFELRNICADASNIILDIVLTSFTAVAKDKNILIEWNIAEEYGNEITTLQRSPNGINFKDIYKVKGEGETVDKRDYQYLDTGASKGNNYYRLKQIDYDGTIEYSNVIVAYLQSEGQMRFFPNIISGQNTINIEGHDRNANYTIFAINTSGQRFALIPSGDKGDVSNLPIGQYYVSINNGEKVEFLSLTVF